ncbi:FMN-binding protein [Candidatus Latescibacterota bacterium]
MFPDVDEVITVNYTLSDADIAIIKERMGGDLIHFQQGSESENVEEITTYDFFIGIKDGEPVRMALFEEQPGKWGPVIFIIAIDIETGTVNNLAVTEIMEKRGLPISRNNFLKQFFGKSSSDYISVVSGRGIKRDIRKITGATISCDCVCFAVRKVIAIFEEVYTKQSFAIAQ